MSVSLGALVEGFGKSKTSTWARMEAPDQWPGARQTPKPRPTITTGMTVRALSDECCGANEARVLRNLLQMQHGFPSAFRHFYRSGSKIGTDAIATVEPLHFVASIGCSPLNRIRVAVGWRDAARGTEIEVGREWEHTTSRRREMDEK